MEKSGVLRAETALAMRDGLFANTPELGSLRHGFLDFSYLRGRRAFGHTGDLVYEHSTMEIYPDEGVAIFISVNTPTGKPLLKALPSAVLDAFFGPAPAAPPRPLRMRVPKRSKVEGTYRTLGLPSYRSERPLLRFLTAFDVRALSDGDVLVNELNSYRPVGDGVFIANDSGERIAFHPQDGRMRFFDAESILPADRIGYFEQNRWLQLIVAVAAFAAAWKRLRRSAPVDFGRPPRTRGVARSRWPLRDLVGGRRDVGRRRAAVVRGSELGRIFTYPGADLYPRRAGRCLRPRSQLHWPQRSLSARCVPPTGAAGSGFAARRR